VKFGLPIVLCLLALLGVAQAAPLLPADPRAAKAVQDYLRQQKEEQGRDQDERVAARIGALADNPASPVLANPQGDITIVEFSDYTCPYCKAAEPRLMRLVDSDKRVKLVMKEFPILTRQSLIASRMALAAAKQGKYRAFHLAMMRREGLWGEAEVMETAKAVGVDVGRARRDMVAPDVTDEIIANFNLARGIRVFQTPAYIVGTHLVTGDSADINFAREVARAKGK
jgi:protein-disulfide isomerase